MNQQQSTTTNAITAADVLAHAATATTQQQQDDTTPTQQQQQQEQQATAPTLAPQQQDELEKKLSMLTKKEREFYLKEKKLKELEERLKKYEQLDHLKSQDPITFLKEAGVDPELLLKKYAEIGGKSLEEKVYELEKRYQELDSLIKQKQQEAERLQAEEQIRAFRNRIQDTVKANNERWEFVNNQEAYDLVFDVIDRHFQSTLQQYGEGEVLPIEKAADMVESYLEDRVKRIVAAKKLQKFIPAQESTEQHSQQKPSVTLSSSLPAGNMKAIQGSTKLLPRDEAIRQISLSFQKK